MNYITILEHFEGALLYVEEGFRESRDLSVERSRRRGFYCIAQRTGRRCDPAVEEDALRGEVALLHRDEVAHRVAECGDVVLGLRCLFPARETEGGKLAAQLGKLSGHSMFAGDTRRLQMCGDCRVVDMMENTAEASILDYPKR